MKKLILIMSCLTFGILSSQNVDKQKTTKVTTVTDTINGKAVERSVKVVTEKEQLIKTDPSDAGKIDADRVFPPTKVTKTFYIDNDNDPFYDKVKKVKYYEMDGETYAFKSSDSGFLISSIDDEKNEKASGSANKSLRTPYYVITSSKFDGVGYFDDNNNFVIEYYDGREKKLKAVEFSEQ